MKIVIVNESKNSGKALQRLIRAAGHKAEFTRFPEVAYTLVRTKEFHAVIMSSSAKNAQDVAARIQERSSGKGTIAFSSKAEDTSGDASQFQEPFEKDRVVQGLNAMEISCSFGLFQIKTIPSYNSRRKAS